MKLHRLFTKPGLKGIIKIANDGGLGIDGCLEFPEFFCLNPSENPFWKVMLELGSSPVRLTTYNEESKLEVTGWSEAHYSESDPKLFEGTIMLGAKDAFVYPVDSGLNNGVRFKLTDVPTITDGSLTHQVQFYVGAVTLDESGSVPALSGNTYLATVLASDSMDGGFIINAVGAADLANIGTVNEQVLIELPFDEELTVSFEDTGTSGTINLWVASQPDSPIVSLDQGATYVPGLPTMGFVFYSVKLIIEGAGTWGTAPYLADNVTPLVIDYVRTEVPTWVEEIPAPELPDIEPIPGPNLFWTDVSDDLGFNHGLTTYDLNGPDNSMTFGNLQDTQNPYGHYYTIAGTADGWPSVPGSLDAPSIQFNIKTPLESSPSSPDSPSSSLIIGWMDVDPVTSEPMSNSLVAYMDTNKDPVTGEYILSLWSIGSIGYFDDNYLETDIQLDFNTDYSLVLDQGVNGLGKITLVETATPNVTIAEYWHTSSLFPVDVPENLLIMADLSVGNGATPFLGDITPLTLDVKPQIYANWLLKSDFTPLAPDTSEDTVVNPETNEELIIGSNPVELPVYGVDYVLTYLIALNPPQINALSPVANGYTDLEVGFINATYSGGQVVSLDRSISARYRLDVIQDPVNRIDNSELYLTGIGNLSNGTEGQDKLTLNIPLIPGKGYVMRVDMTVDAVPRIRIYETTQHIVVTGPNSIVMSYPLRPDSPLIYSFIYPSGDTYNNVYRNYRIENSVWQDEPYEGFIAPTVINGTSSQIVDIDTSPRWIDQSEDHGINWESLYYSWDTAGKQFAFGDFTVPPTYQTGDYDINYELYAYSPYMSGRLIDGDVQAIKFNVDSPIVLADSSDFISDAFIILGAANMDRDNNSTASAILAMGLRVVQLDDGTRSLTIDFLGLEGGEMSQDWIPSVEVNYPLEFGTDYTLLIDRGTNGTGRLRVVKSAEPNVVLVEHHMATRTLPLPTKLVAEAYLTLSYFGEVSGWEGHEGLVNTVNGMAIYVEPMLGSNPVAPPIDAPVWLAGSRPIDMGSEHYGLLSSPPLLGHAKGVTNDYEHQFNFIQGSPLENSWPNRITGSALVYSHDFIHPDDDLSGDSKTFSFTVNQLSDFIAYKTGYSVDVPDVVTVRFAIGFTNRLTMNGTLDKSDYSQAIMIEGTISRWGGQWVTRLKLIGSGDMLTLTTDSEIIDGTKMLAANEPLSVGETYTVSFNQDRSPPQGHLPLVTIRNGNNFNYGFQNNVYYYGVPSVAFVATEVSVENLEGWTGSENFDELLVPFSITMVPLLPQSVTSVWDPVTMMSTLEGDAKPEIRNGVKLGTPNSFAVSSVPVRFGAKCKTPVHISSPDYNGYQLLNLKPVGNMNINDRVEVTVTTEFAKEGTSWFNDNGVFKNDREFGKYIFKTEMTYIKPVGSSNFTEYELVLRKIGNELPNTYTGMLVSSVGTNGGMNGYENAGINLNYDGNDLIVSYQVPNGGTPIDGPVLTPYVLTIADTTVNDSMDVFHEVSFVCTTGTVRILEAELITERFRVW